MSNTAKKPYSPEENATQTRTLLTSNPGSWPWAVAFLLSMSAFGLLFYPALAAIAIIMANRFMKNRYDFMIQFMLLTGGFALTDPFVTGVSLYYIPLALSLLLLLIMHKTKAVKRTLVGMALYVLTLLALACMSEEAFYIQFPILIRYTLFIFFLIPLALFSDKEFEYDKFIRSLWPYALTLCVFYILDAYVLCGWVLIPRSHLWDGATSTFYDLYAAPFSGGFVRKYPPGLYILAFMVYPLSRQYRIRWWQWAIVLLALASTRTFTFISGLMLFFFLFQSGFKRVLRYIIIGIAGFVALYYIDGTMVSVNDDFQKESPLRIKTSVDQIIALSDAADDVDLAEFGSGRFAQAIPKLELLYSLGYEWKGLGFLDRFNTTNTKFIIENEYYLDHSEAIEVATDIEITTLQILITIGYIGLLAHILFFAYTYFIVRKLPYASFYLSVLLLFVWFGMGGFEGLITQMGLFMVGIAYSVPLLCAKYDRSLSPETSPHHHADRR